RGAACAATSERSYFPLLFPSATAYPLPPRRHSRRLLLRVLVCAVLDVGPDREQRTGWTTAMARPQAGWRSGDHLFSPAAGTIASSIFTTTLLGLQARCHRDQWREQHRHSDKCEFSAHDGVKWGLFRLPCGIVERKWACPRFPSSPFFRSAYEVRPAFPKSGNGVRKRGLTPISLEEQKRGLTPISPDSPPISLGLDLPESG